MGEERTISRFEPFRESQSDGVAIVSGGMDSVTMVYLLKDQGWRPHLLSFDYGQRHKKELQFALETASSLQLRWSLIDLSSLTDLIATSALTSSVIPWTPPGELGDMFEDKREIEVPEGHYAEDNMAITVVPNRNMMMMAIATAVCISEKGRYVAAGMHAGDHAQYPDCRPEFLYAMIQTLLIANEGFIDPNFEIRTPWVHKSKADIAQVAYRLGVPLDRTWSCYKGGDIHCGRCGTCIERLEAIAAVEAPEKWDFTEYADSKYWKQAVANFRSK